MSRRGRCRCGTILRFERGPDGYKGRCPGCGSVVRLRAEPPAPRRSGALAFHPRAPSDPEAPYDESVLVPPDQYNYEDLQPGELPVVEMVPLSELLAARRSFWRRWWLPLTAAAVLAASTGLAIGLLR